MTEPVFQSILDRLTGTDQIVVGGQGKSRPALSWGESVDLLKRNLARDLEWLLNTRKMAEPVGPEFEQLSRSLRNYGIPDLSSFEDDLAATATELRRTIQEAIELFEPRLKDVQVTLVRGKGERQGHLRYHLAGDLRLDPDPGSIEFDTDFEMAGKRFKVSDREAND